MANKTPRRKFPWLPTDPEWEAVSAACQSMTHSRGVATVAFLTEQYRQMWQPRAAGLIELAAILQTLRAKKVPFVLTGAHGFAAWTGRPRATHDVDILVSDGRDYARAVNALRRLYPQLEPRQLTGETGFYLSGEKHSVLDVIYPHRADLHETLRTAVWVEEADLRYRVLTLECALANKYGAMLDPARDMGTRCLDLSDFCWMVKHAADPGQSPLDLKTLRDLGRKVTPGGGAGIVRVVEEYRAEKVPNFNAPGWPA